MPVVTCPKCPTKLRVADSATGNVKCPKCGTLFPVAQTPPKPQTRPAFEVVDDAPPLPKPPAAPKSAASPKAAPPPAPAPGAAGNPFSFDDPEAKPKKKKSVFDDVAEGPAASRDAADDEDDRPRKKPRAEADDEEKPRARKQSDGGRKGDKWGGTDDGDEDDDDRPRKKKRRDEDDEDEDDRPRSKKRRRRDDDEDEDDDWHSTPKKKGKGAGFGNAKIGVLLLHISLWMYAAAVGLITFFLFLGLVGAFDTLGSSTTTRRTVTRNGVTRVEESSSGGAAEVAVKLPGILGVGNWVVGAVGLGFCIAGPKRARGMAITAASLAGAHLLLAGISISNVAGLMGDGFGGSNPVPWLLSATMLPVLDSLLPILFYGGAKVIGFDYVLALLSAGCELARLVFAMLMVKELAAAAKDYEAEEKSQLGVMAAGGIGGGAVVFVALVSLLPKAVEISSPKFYLGCVLLVYAAYTAMAAVPLLGTHLTRVALARRAR